MYVCTSMCYYYYYYYYYFINKNKNYKHGKWWCVQCFVSSIGGRRWIRSSWFGFLRVYEFCNIHVYIYLACPYFMFDNNRNIFYLYWILKKVYDNWKMHPFNHTFPQERFILTCLYTPVDGVQTETYSAIVIEDWLLYYLYLPIVYKTTVNPLKVMSKALVPVNYWSLARCINAV
jgi:hypothetical protein